jgi:two-component system sensor histidine kinase/response regulator
MPVMDGLEATVRIRASGRRYVPIIALTANAMSEVRERCRQAGMDDYLSKPVKGSELLAKLQLWVGSKEDPVEQESAMEPTTGAGIREALDQFIANAAADGIETQEVYPLFACLLETSAVLMRDLQDAVEKRNAGLLALAAHTLRGSFASFGLASLAEYTSQLETAAKGEIWDDAEETIGFAQAAYSAAREFIQEKIHSEVN